LVFIASEIVSAFVWARERAGDRRNVKEMKQNTIYRFITGKI
jgi:hypothetical protein